jgi:rod shape determining protein RodA
LLLLPLFFGEATRGAVRWFHLGPVGFQPSEIIKPLFILFFANFLADRKTNFLFFIFYFLFCIPPLFLIFKQPDLGTSLVISAVFLGILFAAKTDFKLLIVNCSLLIAGLPILWHFLQDYQKTRIISFFRPYQDPLGAGYNLIQSVIAVGSGLLFGRGLGRGTQSQLYFLPERSTDFIFASLAEELGLLGSLLLLGAYFLLLWRILTIAKEAADEQGYLIAIGAFSLFLFQVLVNVGMNLGLLPITGITLPLVSLGGSSILAMMITLGLVESVARARKKEEEILEIK